MRATSKGLPGVVCHESEGLHTVQRYAELKMVEGLPEPGNHGKLMWDSPGLLYIVNLYVCFIFRLDFGLGGFFVRVQCLHLNIYKYTELKDFLTASWIESM